MMTHSLPVLGSFGDSAAPPPQAPVAAREAGQQGRLIDSHGRTIRDLRLSVTDRCNFRCVYCMDPDVRFLPKRQLLKADQLIRLARVTAHLGVEKIRLTGGEPLVYPELDDVIRGIAQVRALNGKQLDVALTTNGSLLDEARLASLRRAGLSRMTISIDSVSGARFAGLTRSNASPAEVLNAVEGAIRAGFSPVKVNAVVLRNMNEDEVPGLAQIARDLGVEMRFIEFMPLDSARAWDRARLVPASEIVARINARFPLIPAGRDDVSSTASIYRFADGAPGRIGIIASVTRSFCNACSRLRITADGKVRPCLFSNREWDLRPLFRAGAGDEEIAQFLIDATWMKEAGHGISSNGFTPPQRPMSAIGG